MSTLAKLLLVLIKLQAPRKRRGEAVPRRLMMHSGVRRRPVLADELVIGTQHQFHCGKQIASYVGLVPEQKSSGSSTFTRSN